GPGMHELVRALDDVGELAVLGQSHVQAHIPLGVIPVVAGRLASLGLEVQLLTATDTRATSGDFTLTYVFAPPGGAPVATMLTSTPADAPRFPSLATRSFAASRLERDIQDLFGLEPIGHPDPRRLTLHQFWPSDYWPLRRDAATRADVVDRGEPFPFRRVEGE